MARLLILRHGKQNWYRKQDATLIVNWLNGVKETVLIWPDISKAILTIPDVILVSPAVRTIESAEWVMKEWSQQPEYIIDERIYNASSDTLFDLIHEHAGDTSTVMIIGHNPGMILLCHDLIAEDGNQAGKDVNDYPTATLADMVFDLDQFKDLERESGKLLSLIRPRDMVKVDDKGRLN